MANQDTKYHPHILCTQLVNCLLSHFIHIWYLGWPWSEHAHIIPISQMVDFWESYSPFHVCLTIRLSAHLVYAASLLSHFIHIWYLGWPWSEHVHIIPISRIVYFCASYSPFHVCLTICPSAHLVYATSHSQKSTIREIGNIWECSDHGQSRYQIWIKCDKRLVAYTRCADRHMVKQTWKGL
jgi:hypothetical protein